MSKRIVLGMAVLLTVLLTMAFVSHGAVASIARWEEPSWWAWKENGSTWWASEWDCHTSLGGAVVWNNAQWPWYGTYGNWNWPPIDPWWDEHWDESWWSCNVTLCSSSILGWWWNPSAKWPNYSGEDRYWASWEEGGEWTQIPAECGWYENSWWRDLPTDTTWWFANWWWHPPAENRWKTQIV